ncbi:RNA 2',3'-cyclic phosphodiesterase [Nitrogeniibacter mangrovi]|uniref:RNA 2',3'-cyclic phosphodiesterase n=1 Tax=Nitrogeniibacter mangrovi TaxID=2016596 RepID=A0A6C1B2F2_9RHOO|nr:RNA 2',3'-cyclic phosphodiesterase [Nitrogeniibacter mangrovi]QID17822.1 RNA 2',3'-cyclic phosphodiesterase [Nitrogeniibacter mangrovi]
MNAATERLRVFYALWPDRVTADALARLGRAAAPAHARRMRTDTLHATLAFVGDVDTVRLSTLLAIGDAMAWPAGDLCIDRVAHWPHNGIVWAGFAPLPAPFDACVAQLHERLAEAGIDLPARAFVPHVTLARKAQVLRPAHHLPLPISWPVDGAVLVASERDHSGARYRCVRRWPALARG